MITIAFPTITDAFCDVQAQLMGEPIHPSLQEAIGAWVPVFNACFQDGLKDDTETHEGDLARMDALLDTIEDAPTLTQFLTSARVWMDYAFQRGRHRRFKS